WFYGAGAYVGFENGDTYLGPTGIIGLDYKFTNAPINLSLDWKPELDFLPDINFVPDAFAFTIRFAIKRGKKATKHKSICPFGRLLALPSLPRYYLVRI